MNIEEFVAYCLTKPQVWEDTPFDDVTLCMKVGKKVFAITGMEKERFEVNLKCEPNYALELREKHPEIRNGWHMNNKHWNTVDFEGTLSEKMLKHLIDHSYEMVVKGMTKKARTELGLV